MANTTKNTLAVLPPSEDVKMFMIFFFIGDFNWNWEIMEMDSGLAIKTRIDRKKLQSFPKIMLIFFQKCLIGPEIWHDR